MAVKIKLKRLGKIRNPQYRVVVADARNKRDGRSIEEIGIYQPKLEPSLIRIDSDRAQYWLGVGAQPTDAVMVLLKITGDWQKHKGLPGAEGTLRVAEVAPSQTIAYEEAARAAITESAKPKRKLAPASAPAATAAADAADAATDAVPATDAVTDAVPAVDAAPAADAVPAVDAAPAADAATAAPEA